MSTVPERPQAEPAIQGSAAPSSPGNTEGRDDGFTRALRLMAKPAQWSLPSGGLGLDYPPSAYIDKHRDIYVSNGEGGHFAVEFDSDEEQVAFAAALLLDGLEAQG